MRALDYLDHLGEDTADQYMVDARRTLGQAATFEQVVIEAARRASTPAPGPGRQPATADAILAHAVALIRHHRRRQTRRRGELARLRERVTDLGAIAKVGIGLYRSAERDVTDAQATLARVRELAERWKYTDREQGPRRELLAALDGPAAAEQAGGDRG